MLQLSSFSVLLSRYAALLFLRHALAVASSQAGRAGRSVGSHAALLLQKGFARSPAQAAKVPQRLGWRLAASALHHRTHGSTQPRRSGALMCEGRGLGTGLALCIPC